MIEFKGEMSKNDKRKIKHVQAFWLVFVLPEVYVMLFIPLFAYFLSNDFFGETNLLAMGCAFIVGSLLVLLCYSLYNVKNDIPLRIEITDTTIKSECRKKKYVNSLSNVSKVVDLGDFYSIRVNQCLEHARFMCKKDLLTQGTLEEFENLFADKMVRKEKMHRD